MTLQHHQAILTLALTFSDSGAPVATPCQPSAPGSRSSQRPATPI
jgi:hypothetical protein